MSGTQELSTRSYGTDDQTELLAHLDELAYTAQSEDPVVAAKAMRELYTQALPVIDRIIGKFALSPSDTEDLTQEASIRVIRGVENGKYLEGNFLAWTNVVAQNSAITYFRSLRRQVQTTPIDHCSSVEITYAQPSAEDQALGTTSTEPIIRVFQQAKVKAAYYEPYVLFHINGMPPDQIANKLGIGVSTLRTRIHRAKIGLLEHLGLPETLSEADKQVGRIALGQELATS